MNNLTIAGNIGKIGEIEFTKNTQTKVIKFSVAVRNRDNTDWFECTAFDKTAEYIGNYGFVGAPVCVNGEIHFRDWTDKDGVKHKAHDVIARNIDVIGKKPEQTRDDVKVPEPKDVSQWGAKPQTIDGKPIQADDDNPYF